MQPLIAHDGAVKALRRFALGKIDARALERQLSSVARETGTPPKTVTEFVYRAVCAKFGLSATATEGEGVKP
jgi:hypothetical protein